ncbi:MAG: winged helix-turn-helix transcriptional regulator [Bacteroidetes bacterium]|nr:winged helix-turn-helix transcriptional regulator [Bacteroidota bacterium]
MYEHSQKHSMQKDNRTTELNILNYIEQSSDATQRELSKQVGVSLGTINLLLKKMAKKGLIKIERLQPNSIKYFLTPAGIANKIERTYGYVVRTYREIEKLRKRIVDVIKLLSERYSGNTVVFFGQSDEMYEIIGAMIRSEAFSMQVVMCNNLDELVAGFDKENLVIVWNEEHEKILEKENIMCMNIMRTLVL